MRITRPAAALRVQLSDRAGLVTAGWRLRALTGAALATAVLLVTHGAAAQRASDPGPLLAPFVTTPAEVVLRMLDLAQVTSHDVVYDLGSGDGRIVIAAARKYGARGVGIEIERRLVEQARAAARLAGVEALVSFREEDLLKADLSEATVVTVYLLAAANQKLRSRLQAQLKPGARVVSHSFSMGDWEPDEVVNFPDGRGTARTLYLWTIR